MARPRTTPIRPRWRSASTGGVPDRDTRDRPATETVSVEQKISGLVPYSFEFAALSGTVTAQQGTRGNNVSAISIGAPYAGSIVGLAFASETVLSAGSATFTAFIAGGASDASIRWTALSSDEVAFLAGTVPFDAGESLDVRATTTSLAPSSDIEVILYVTYSL